MAEWVNAGYPEELAARKAFRSLSRDAYGVTILVAGALVVAMDMFGEEFGMDKAGAGTAFVIYAAISAIALGNLHAHGHDRFGAANIVTTVRAAIAAAIGGLVLASDGFGEASDAGALWFIGFLVAFALVLDGVDGYLARRTRTASRFGARFDMEVDALLIFFLALGVFVLGKVDVWVLLIGLMRYGFAAATAVIPALRGELAPSTRRKAICVVQGVVLCLILFPVVVPPLSTALAAGALILLIHSFAADVIFLLQANRGQHAA